MFGIVLPRTSDDIDGEVRSGWDGNMRKSPKSKNPSIKALTIRQPWAELILRGRKPYELRSWRTNYRGALLIHSAMRMDTEFARKLGLNPEKLTAGAFVGVAVLSDVRPYTREDSRLLKKKRAGGGWYPNLFSWSLRSPTVFRPRSRLKDNMGCSTFHGL
jgi:hypothetical protein